MRILVIAPHADDEVLGVGGTMAKFAARGDEVFVCVVTRGTLPLYTEDYVRLVQSECRRAHEILGVKQTFFLDFPAVMLETVPRYQLNGKLLELVSSLQPEEVYIPHRGDIHLDHKMVADAAMVAVRPRGEHPVQRVYAYETMSETRWDIPNAANEFIPTVYEDISDWLEKKEAALGAYQSQMAPFPSTRSIEAVRALAMLRGATVGVSAAETFSLIRQIR